MGGCVLMCSSPTKLPGGKHTLFPMEIVYRNEGEFLPTLSKRNDNNGSYLICNLHHIVEDLCKQIIGPHGIF